MNLIGVLVQLVLPCSAPCYELIYGLTAANYDMKGSPRGLARVYKFALGIWSLSITPRRQHSTRLIPIALLPPNYAIYLGVLYWASIPRHCITLPDEFKGSAALAPPPGLNALASG